VLVPRKATTFDQQALFDVEDGSLELRGCRVRFDNADFARLPEHMLRAKNADLRLIRCQLNGPLAATAEGYQSLIRLEGSGQGDADKTPACTVSESVLISGRNVLQVTGTGQRLALAGSLVVAADNVLQFEPGPFARAALAVQCLLDRNTVALKGSLIHLGDTTGPASPVEPIVIQADNNLFFDPFREGPHRATLLHYDGQALPRGLLLWQGQGNGYDLKGLFAYVAPGPIADTPQGLAVWKRLWGSRGEQHSRPVDFSKSKERSLSLAKLSLQQLAQSSLHRPRQDEPPLGADLEVLGIGENKQ
jgi:hypothetical protein